MPRFDFLQEQYWEKNILPSEIELTTVEFIVRLWDPAPRQSPLSIVPAFVAMVRQTARVMSGSIAT